MAEGLKQGLRVLGAQHNVTPVLVVDTHTLQPTHGVACGIRSTADAIAAVLQQGTVLDGGYTGNTFQAEVLLKSVLRAGTANNDINPIKSIGLLSEGASVISRLTSPTAWWVQTDAPEGMKLMMRRALEKTMEGDFETDSMRYKATERYDIGWTDPRAMYGTPGV